MTKLLSAFSLLLFGLISSLQYYLSPTVGANWDEKASVSEVLYALGEQVATHGVSKASAEQIRQGKELVLTGITQNGKGKYTAKQSKHFVCTSCHNIKVEDPDLSNPNPESRLDYAMANKLPFLQGTTLYGIVNRTSWYNGDYYKKYGDLVKPARNNLREAVQLCAVQCAQGRALDNWEIDAVIAYLWSLELQLGDLALSDDEWKTLKTAKETTEKAAAAEMLKGKYFAASPATFGDAYASKTASEKLTGNAERGQAIYELSCQHCHKADKGITHYRLDDSPMTFRMLARHFNKYNNFSIYQVSRYGTHPMHGYRPYMPQYPLERMSNQQLADLKAYINSKK